MVVSAPSTASPVRRFDSPQQEAFLQLWRTYDCLKAIEEELFSEFELSAQQYNALRLLAAAAPEGLQTLELARRLISRAPDITRMLDRLEKRELVARRRREENRRTVEVTLTRQGQSLLDAMATQVRAMHDKQLGHLEPDALEALSRLLRRAREPHLSKDPTCWVDG